MSIITVNKSECTQCDACVESCPLYLIDHNEDMDTWFPIILEDKEDKCVYCGHCESVCPSGALTHKLSDKAIKSNDSVVRGISPEEISVYFKSRRSIRQYKHKPVDKQTLEKVMDVVRYAPTGTNRQMNQWFIITDAGIISKLSEMTVDWMRKVSATNVEMASRMGIARVIAGYENGKDVICRNAPCLAIAFTSTSYPGGLKDAVIAASHLDLLLPSFNLGGCWAGYIMAALQYSPEMKSLIGIDETHTVHAALMIGYPKYKYKKIPARNEVNIKWM